MFPLFGQRLTVPFAFFILLFFFFSINKPGGCAKITKIHYAAADGSNIEALDVKYILGGSEKNIDPAIVSPYETLERGGRKRRGREFLLDQVPDGISNPKGSGGVKEQERQKSVEQDEPPKPSPQSSPTTPTTPEQNNKKKQKATRVTPIPSIIIADRIMEVSPLPVDRSCKKQPQEQSLARRGLFERDKGKASKDKKVFTAKPPPQSDTKIAVGATASKYATSATPTRGATARTAPTQRTTFNPTMLNVAKRPTPLSAEKPILQLPRPKTKSPHTDNLNVKSVPLRRVFENEKRRAREFIDDICRPRNNDIIPDPSKENTTLSTSSLDRKKPPVSPS